MTTYALCFMISTNHKFKCLDTKRSNRFLAAFMVSIVNRWKAHDKANSGGESTRSLFLIGSKDSYRRMQCWSTAFGKAPVDYTMNSIQLLLPST